MAGKGTANRLRVSPFAVAPSNTSGASRLSPGGPPVLSFSAVGFSSSGEGTCELPPPQAAVGVGPGIVRRGVGADWSVAGLVVWLTAPASAVLPLMVLVAGSPETSSWGVVV